MNLRRGVDAWGRVTFHGDDAVELLLCGHDLANLLFTPNDTVAVYNQVCLQHDKTANLIQLATPPDQSPAEIHQTQIADWFMPDFYRAMPVRERLLALCQRPDEVARVTLEMDLYEERDLIPVLQLMWFLVDHFRANGIVWGVGRGSSVASYCLFKIGLHRIDAIHYDLDIREFLK